MLPKAQARIKRRERSGAHLTVIFRGYNQDAVVSVELAGIHICAVLGIFAVAFCSLLLRQVACRVARVRHIKLVRLGIDASSICGAFAARAGCLCRAFAFVQRGRGVADAREIAAAAAAATVTAATAVLARFNEDQREFSQREREPC